MSAHTDDLEPVNPSTARELFLDNKEGNCVEATVRNYRYHLRPFVEWCEEEGFDNLNHLSGRDLQQFRLWRKDTSDLNRMMIKNQMSSLRVFLDWAALIETVPSDLYDKIMIPRVPPEERQRDGTVDAGRAEEIPRFGTQRSD